MLVLIELICYAEGDYIGVKEFKDVFHMRMAQAGNKAIHVAESNAILGEWLRKRLNVPSGEFITKEMLEHYGKTSVKFRKYEDGTYLLDF